MAFIKNTERAELIKKTNKSYAVKKLLLLVDIVALLVFVVMVFVSWMLGTKSEGWAWFDGDKLTTLGAGMLAFAIIIVALGIVCVVLVFTIKSPKKTIEMNKKLESSALSGKRVYKSQTAGEVMKARTTMKDDKKKK